MELDVFLQLFNKENPDEVKNAVETILKSSEEPTYIQLLFQFLQTPECQKNLTIEKGIHITIVNLIRSHWNSFNDLSESSSANIYWDQDQQSQISNHLLEILFSIPNSRRENIIECFRFIMIGSFPNNINVAESLVQLLDEHSSSFEDCTTIINIIVFWSKACGKSYIPDELLEKVELVTLEITERFAAIASQVEPPQSFPLLRFVSKSIKNFIKKLNSPLNCENFDNILQTLVNSLAIESKGQENNELKLLKRSILNLFIELCKTFFPQNSNQSEEENQDIRVQYSSHFKENIAPALLQALIETLSIEQDSYNLSSIIYLFYLFLMYNVGERSFLTTEFITNLIIPVARLSKSEIKESEINPLQYMAFNLSYTTTVENRTTRNTTAALLGEILKIDSLIDDIYDFLLAPTVNKIDFEGRIFLMTKFVKATMTKMGPMVDGNVVDALVEQTKQVDTLPPYLITSLLMFMDSVLPFLDSELGCTLASHCIMQSDSEIVICAASNLLRNSIIECDERVDLPIPDIIPKLLNLALEINYEELSKSVEALIQMGGEAIFPYINETIKGLLELCNQSLAEKSYKECSSTLYSMFEIINAIPDDEPILVELSETLLPACIEFFNKYPENDSFKDIFSIISVFNTKIDNITKTMIQTYVDILQIIKKDIDVYSNAMIDIAYIMCPIIAHSEFKENSQLIASTVDTLMHLIKTCMSEEDKDDLAYVILTIATLIQSIGESGFPFIQHVCNALTAVDDDKSTACLFSACVFAFASALIVNTEKALDVIPKEAIEFIWPKINKSTCQTYKELKMGVVFLLNVSQIFEGAYFKAVDSLQALCDRKIENNMNLEDKMATAAELIKEQGDNEAEFAPLVITFKLPFDSFDEFQLFGEITQNSGLFQKLSSKQQSIVNDIFK